MNGEHSNAPAPLATDLVPSECWSADEEFFNYDSLGELLDNCRDDLEPGSTVYVGQKVPADPTVFFDADDLADRLGEVAYDNHGECAEDWPGPLDAEAKREFNDFLDAWMKKHCPANFWNVTHVRHYTITAEDLQE